MERGRVSFNLHLSTRAREELEESTAQHGANTARKGEAAAAVIVFNAPGRAQLSEYTLDTCVG